MTCLKRKFGYVEFESEEDMQKALELNGKKFMGQELKMDKARSKESSQDNKKGKAFIGCLCISMKAKNTHTDAFFFFLTF